MNEYEHTTRSIRKYKSCDDLSMREPHTLVSPGVTFCALDFQMVQVRMEDRSAILLNDCQSLEIHMVACNLPFGCIAGMVSTQYLTPT
jgi:hypothetical protein